jgi:hypothetical protein
MRLGMWIGPVAALMTLAARTVDAETPAVEAIDCPAVGDRARVDAIVRDGRVYCHYTSSGNEPLATKTVGSKSGAPIKSCLRSRSNESRMFCSTSASQADLNASAYTWAAWTGDNKKYIRATLGNRKRRNGLTSYGPSEQLYPCRFKHENAFRVGYVQGSFCVAASGKKVVQGASWESMLLTKEYGKLTTHRRYGAPVIAVPLSMMAVQLCEVYVKPAELDLNGVMGYLPGAMIAGMCVSVLDGKQVSDTRGKVAVLE